MHHFLALAPPHGTGHALSTIWSYIQRFIKVILIVATIGLLLWRGGLNWIQGIIMMALGALIVVGFSPKVGSFIEKVNSGNTVSSTGATIGELAALGILFVLALLASRG